MRENRTHGSEGGEAATFPTPIDGAAPRFIRSGSAEAGVNSQ